MECKAQNQQLVTLFDHTGFDPEFPESFPWELVEPRELGEEAQFMCRVMGNFPENLVRELRAALNRIAREVTIRIYF